MALGIGIGIGPAFIRGETTATPPGAIITEGSDFVITESGDSVTIE